MFPFGRESAGVATVVVAIFGTTISPYLFFWQSAEEVEEIAAHPGEHPLKDAPREPKWQLPRIRFDTFVGMGVSNLVALAVMIATAATLHAAGKTDIKTAADAAEALRPVAGPFAFALFSLGHHRHRAPGRAGARRVRPPMPWARPWASNAGWSTRRSRRSASTPSSPRRPSSGVGIEWSPLDPIKALFWSAVINGVVAGPILAATLIAASSERVMGQFKIGRSLQVFGWATALLMAGSSVMMLLQR